MTDVWDEGAIFMKALAETAETWRERYETPNLGVLPEVPDLASTPWHRRKVKKFTESETKAILHNVNTKLRLMNWR